MTRARETGGEQEFSDEQQLRLLIDSVTDYAIFVLAPDGRVMSWNAGAEKIKGYTADEIIGEHFSRFYTDVDRASDHPGEELRLATRDGSFAEEGWRVRKDGTRFWAAVTITALRRDGELVGFGKVTRDLTPRREAELALRAQTDRLQEANERLDRFRRLVSGVADYAIFMLDAEGRVATWNAGAENIKGYRAEEIIGEHFSRFYPEKEREAGHPEDELVIATREGVYEEEGWRVRKDGSRFWATVVITALRDDDGKLEGFAKVTRDLTERRLASQQLDEANRELQRTNEEMRIFSSAAAHDLREPLRTIAGFAELLLRRYADEMPDRARDLLTKMTLSVDRMTELVDALLSFARSGAREMKPEAVSIVDVAASVTSALAAAIAERGGGVHVEVPGDVAVRADRPLVEIVLQNFVENGLKFGSATHPEVRIGAVRRGAAWRVTVRDDGLGIDARDHEAVFEPFRRLHGRGEFTGSGLGLATCRRAVERQGGTVGVESALGAGSTFWFELPAA